MLDHHHLCLHSAACFTHLRTAQHRCPYIFTLLIIYSAKSNCYHLAADNMPRRPVWSADERRLASLAWYNSTNDPIVGCNQMSQQFTLNIHSVLSRLSPRDADSGCYAGRGAVAVYTFLRDKFFPDIQKFNAALNLVYSSNPTGATEQQIVNMAVAIYLNSCCGSDQWRKA